MGPTLLVLDRPFPLPVHVRTILNQISAEGHLAYVVGGSVRDFLLDRKTKDFDLVTGALPDQLLKLFPQAVTVGKQFGVIKVPQLDGSLVEVATFRSDGVYEDARHPTSVRFSGPEEDALRRDFTVNALFFDPKGGRIIDFVGGLEDLKKGLLRAIGSPADRFKEDALRLLRAVRFSSQLAFQLDESTQKAIFDNARLVARTSLERVRDEIDAMWVSQNPAQALERLCDLQLLDWTVPELLIVKKRGDWSRALMGLRRMAQLYPNRTAVLPWAYLLQMVAKLEDRMDPLRLIESVGSRLKWKRVDLERVVQMVTEEVKMKDCFQMRESTLVRWVTEPFFQDLLQLHHINALAGDGNLAFFDFCSHRFLEWKKNELDPVPKLLTGADLIALGLTPGPRFAQILRTVEDLAIEKQLTTQEQALEFVLKHYI